MNLQNKVVVITGASKGLGKALALAFHNEGATVVISARPSKELKATGEEVGATTYAGDVTSEADMKKLSGFVYKKFKKIDLWVNNAGIVLPHMLIEKIDAKRAHQVMEVNFFGTFYGSRAALSIMKRQRQGTIINIISMSGLTGRPLSSIYSSSKWAARGFTEALRMALKPFNITVLAVHPGGFKTTIFGKFKPAGYNNWMEPAYVAKKIIKNVKQKNPRIEIVINK